MADDPIPVRLVRLRGKYLIPDRQWYAVRTCTLLYVELSILNAVSTSGICGYHLFTRYFNVSNDLLYVQVQRLMNASSVCPIKLKKKKNIYRKFSARQGFKHIKKKAA